MAQQRIKKPKTGTQHYFLERTTPFENLSKSFNLYKKYLKASKHYTIIRRRWYGECPKAKAKVSYYMNRYLDAVYGKEKRIYGRW